MKISCIPIDNHIKLVQPELIMAEQLFQVIDENRTYLSKYLPFIDDTHTVQDESEYIKLMLAQHARGTARLFFIYSDDELIGTIDLHEINQTHKKASIGYWLAQNYTNQGITTRCVQTLCDFAFNTLDLNKLMIHANVKNQPSIRVAERCGFTYVGIDKDDLYERGQFEDFVRYALLKREFQTKANKN